jgi:hypothetical protein
MATVTMMVTVTKDQWLELHWRTLDCVRAVIRDLPPEKLLWEPGTTQGSTEESSCHEPRPFCIGAIVTHLCEVAAHRLGEMHLRPNFAAPAPGDWNARTLAGILDRVEDQYRDILAQTPKDRHVLFGLGRLCQHNLYHLPQLVHLRTLQEPGWKLPASGLPGSWEHAADFITDLLIYGDKATLKASES